MYLGNADSILIRHFDNGVKTVILIDGGRKQHTPLVRKLLKELGETKIHHLVCSHHHEDHAAGLVDLVQDSSLSIDKAWLHLGDLIVDRIDRSRFQTFANLLIRAQASKEAQNQLVQVLQKRRIPTDEPFAVANIGPLLVVSPTREFYNAQLELMRKDEIVSVLNERYKQRDLKNMMRALGYDKSRPEDEEDDGELGAEPTSPENEISTILFLPWTESDGSKKGFLFTADAGTAALSDLKSRSENANGILKQLTWMQIPHHGSRRNLNLDLIDYYRPKTGFVSARGSKKHPSTKLINAFRDQHCKVYGTHYPPEKTEGTWIRQTQGTVPEMVTTPAIPLWEKKSG